MHARVWLNYTQVLRGRQTFGLLYCPQYAKQACAWLQPCGGSKRRGLEAGERGFYRSGYGIIILTPVAYLLLLPKSLAVLKPGRLLLCLLRMVCLGIPHLMGMQNYGRPPRLCLSSPLQTNLYVKW